MLGKRAASGGVGGGGGGGAGGGGGGGGGGPPPPPLDGFWINRVLLSEGIESHFVDAASVEPSRRRRRAKTDRIDGETLLRALLAHKRGEPRVCSMVRAPTPER